METPVVVDERERERERERVISSPSFLRRHKILFGVFVAISIIVYAAFNVWVYRVSTSGKALSPTALWQTVTSSNSGFGVLKGDSPPRRGVTFTETVTPSPTTTRPTGPGQYACDEYGICNNYEDAKRVGCPKTYADPHCLNECGDTKVRCLKTKL